MIKVFEKCCNNCLFSKDRIVSSKGMKSILDNCIRQQSYFICHKASMNGDDIMCNTYFEKFGHYSQMVRIAERLNAIRMMPQTDSTKLPTWKQMNKK